jgi:acyl carrier protein
MDVEVGDGRPRDARQRFAAKIWQECQHERALSAPPASPLEVRLAAEVVSPLTGWLSIGRDEDLFALGIDSFELIELLLAVESTFSTRVDVVSMFEQPTVARLAELVEQALAAPPPDTALPFLDAVSGMSDAEVAQRLAGFDSGQPR